MLKTFVHADEEMEEVAIMMRPPACVGVMETCLGPVGLTVHAHPPTVLHTNRNTPVSLEFHPGLILKEITHIYSICVYTVYVHSSSS